MIGGDISDADGPVADAPYFLRDVPPPMDVTRVSVSGGGILPSPPAAAGSRVVL